MLWIVYELGFPTDAIYAVKNLYEDATTQIRLPAGGCTQKIPVERGSIQGDTHSMRDHWQTEILDGYSGVKPAFLKMGRQLSIILGA